jgi:ribosomal protein L7/L12
VQSTVNPIKPSFVTPYPEESFTISDIQHLYLVDSGPNKINCIKVIRKLLRNELAEAVQMMEQASPKKPVLILEDVDATNIETAKQEFEAVGCKVEIK